MAMTGPSISTQMMGCNTENPYLIDTKSFAFRDKP
jgi:hypothetical protein